MPYDQLLQNHVGVYPMTNALAPNGCPPPPLAFNNVPGLGCNNASAQKYDAKAVGWSVSGIPDVGNLAGIGRSEKAKMSALGLFLPFAPQQEY